MGSRPRACSLFVVFEGGPAVRNGLFMLADAELRPPALFGTPPLAWGHTCFGRATLRAWNCAPQRCLGRLPAWGGILVLGLLPCGNGFRPSGAVWDASLGVGAYLFWACCPADAGLRPPALFGTPPGVGQGGLLGAAPLLGPLCTPPGTPPKRVFNFRKTARATRL